MANPLENLLQPGETVLWRWSSDRSIVGFGAGALLMLGFALLVTLGADDPVLDGLLIGAWILAGAMLIGTCTIYPSSRSLITNRRLLVRRRSERDGNLFDTGIGLECIESAHWQRRGSSISAILIEEAGTRHKIHDIRDSRAIRTAIGPRLGDSLPSLGKIPQLLFVCTLLAYGVGIYLWVAMDGLHQVSLPGVVATLVSIAAMGPLFLLSRIFALFLTVLMMPNFARREEAEAWFSLSSKRTFKYWGFWQFPLYRHLASWRYGTALGNGEVRDGV